MTLALCVIAAIMLFAGVVLASREVIGIGPIRLNWALHGLSVLLIVIAITTRGLWYHASLYLADIWVAHDALLKTAQGLRSSVDYFNPIGPVFEWLLALTLLVQPPSTSSLILANAFVGIAALLLSFGLLRHRASPLTIAVVGLIAVTTALSPRDVDIAIPFGEVSMLAPYNRWGWALLLPVAMRAALPDLRRDHSGAVLAGFAISLLLLLKVTYGFAAIGIFVVALLVQPARWRETGLVGAALLISLLLIDLVTGGQVRAHFGDLAMAVQMSSNVTRFGKFVGLLPSFAAFAAGTLVMLLAVTRQEGEGPWPPLRRNWRALILSCAVGASGLVVLMQNHYATEAATLLVMPLIIAEWTGLTKTAGGHLTSLWQRGGEWIAIAVLIALAYPAIDAGFIMAQKVQTMRTPAPEAFAGTPMRDLVVDKIYLPEAGKTCGTQTCHDVQRMVSGRELLKRQCPSYREKAVVAFNFANPFPAYLSSPSPRHAPIWLHTDRSFSGKVHVPASKLFSDVGCVISAKGESNAIALEAIYDEELQRAFNPVAGNTEWKLWVRK